LFANRVAPPAAEPPRPALPHLLHCGLCGGGGGATASARRGVEAEESVLGAMTVPPLAGAGPGPGAASYPAADALSVAVAADRLARGDRLSPFPSDSSRSSARIRGSSYRENVGPADPAGCGDRHARSKGSVATPRGTCACRPNRERFLAEASLDRRALYTSGRGRRPSPDPPDAHVSGRGRLTNLLLGRPARSGSVAASVDCRRAARARNGRGDDPPRVRGCK
jgi:hypothetical protein